MLAGLPALEDFSLSLIGLGIRYAEYDGKEDAESIALTDIAGNVAFPRLRRLALGGAWLEADDLNSFLLRHSATLEDIFFVDVAIGGLRDAPASPKYAGLKLVPMGQRCPVQSVLSSDWDRVAEACQQLPYLKGLAIRANAPGPETVHRGTHRMLELADLGMNGRPNIYDEFLASDREYFARMAEENG